MVKPTSPKEAKFQKSTIPTLKIIYFAVQITTTKGVNTVQYLGEYAIERRSKIQQV